MNKFSLWLTYSTCKNTKRKPQQTESMCFNYTTYISLLKKLFPRRFDTSQFYTTIFTFLSLLNLINCLLNRSLIIDIQCVIRDDRASWKILIINQKLSLISQIYFWNKILHVSDSYLSIIRSFSLYTQQWYMS